MQENQNLSEEFSYDVIAYPSQILLQTHPTHLAAVAKLYGMNPAPADKCRVLELGCGTGTNLNWQAHGFPESEFVGIDLAQNHIVEAKQDAEELGLQNVSFFQQDVMEITEKTFGKFDYIIAHGLYSWVPDFVREKVLSLYDGLLNAEGIGFISYNVYPGAYRRRIMMDMMKFHTRGIETPIEKVKKGIGFIEFLTEQTAQPQLNREILNAEFENLVKYPLEKIYHDELAEVSQPFYFTEFIADAEKHNLKFLSESENLPTQKDNFPEEIIQAFENISRNIVEYEQFADFLECRRFRQTLLCKKDVVLETKINPSKLKDLYISSLLKPTSPTIDLSPDSFKEFLNFKNEGIDVGHNLTKVVLANLVNLGAHLNTFNELIEKANEILNSQGILYEDLEQEAEITASLLLQLYSPNAIGFHTGKPDYLDYVSERPIAGKFTRWQAKRGDLAINFCGAALNIQDDSIRLLLNLLDGTRTREDLIKDLVETIKSNNEIADDENFLTQMTAKLDRDLFILAKMGFLVG